MIYHEITMFLLLVVTMILWGAAPILEKAGLQEVDPFTGVLIRSVTVTIILLVIYLVSGRLTDLARVSLKNIALFSASGILAGLLAMLTYYYALRLGATSKIVPIAAAYPLITTVLGILFLGEDVTFQRIIGIILTIAGIILVKQS